MYVPICIQFFLIPNSKDDTDKTIQGQKQTEESSFVANNKDNFIQYFI